MILCEDKDTLVDISGSQKAAEAYEAVGTDVCFQIVSGRDHIFLKLKDTKEATNIISKFLEILYEG